MPRPRLLVDTRPLREYPEFRRLWYGYAASQIGAQLGVVAVAYQVFRLTHSSLDVGFVSLAQLAPAFLGSVLGGSIADAFDRRKVLLVTESSMALCAAGLGLNALSGHPMIAVIYLLSALNAGFSGADGPTRMAVLIEIVDSDSVVSANALRQLSGQLSVIVGPSIGGILLASFGITVVYFANAGAMFLALFSVMSVAARPPEGGGTRFGWESIAEGFAFLKGRQALQGTFVADLNAMVLGMPTALFPALGLLHFHGGARAVGYLYSAPGVGAFVISVFSGWATRTRRLGLAICVAIVIWGLAIAGFGLVRSLPIALVLLAIAGAADVISAVFRNTVLQTETPDRLRGRLSAIHIAVVTGGPRIGNLEAGGVAALAGTQFSVVSGGIGCIVGIALVAKLMPRFFHYRLPDNPAPSVPGTTPTDEATPSAPAH